MIMICNNINCINEYQNKTHGYKKRVHNELGSKDNTYRCTVCSNERSGYARKEI